MDQFDGVRVQENPNVYCAVIPGRWLLSHCTPSWRREDPELGFQRVVSEARARIIAASVLDQQRSFPNAIVLATDSTRITHHDGVVNIPRNTMFLVVDGQHRLWAQKFSNFDAPYACMVHVGLDETRMAELFLEINDNQKRVPSSLRWDLVRLVKPDDDPAGLRAADLVYDLATDKDSPLFSRIDLTGENPEISLKQGSIAPEIKRLVSQRAGFLSEESYDTQFGVFVSFFAAVRDRDADGWVSGKGPLYKARVIRGLLRAFPEIIEDRELDVRALRARDILAALKKLDLDTLSDDAIRAVHGNAGIAQITTTIRSQVLED